MDNETLLLPDRVKQIAKGISESDLLDDLRLIEQLVQAQIKSIEGHIRRLADGLRTTSA